MKRRFNDKELELIDYIESAESYVSGDNELEMDFYNGGWYAHEYNGANLVHYMTIQLIR